MHFPTNEGLVAQTNKQLGEIAEANELYILHTATIGGVKYNLTGMHLEVVDVGGERFDQFFLDLYALTDPGDSDPICSVAVPYDAAQKAANLVSTLYYDMFDSE